MPSPRLARVETQLQHPAQLRTARRLAHLVHAGTLGLPVHVVGLELVVNGDVEVTVVLLAGLVLEDTRDGLTLLDGQDVLEVKDRLLPVSVFCVGAGGELDGLVAAGKLDVEPGNQRVDEVATADLELVG